MIQVLEFEEQPKNERSLEALRELNFYNLTEWELQRQGEETRALLKTKFQPKPKGFWATILRILF